MLLSKLKEKETQVKIQPWVSANRPSNNWAQLQGSTYSKGRRLHLMKLLIAASFLCLPLPIIRQTALSLSIFSMHTGKNSTNMDQKTSTV